jgi:hypothetical protein
VFAQPLYVSGVTITTGWAAGTVHNVVYVATSHDSLYALDGQTGYVLWKSSFISPEAGITPLTDADYQGFSFTDELGILGTPVIDPSSQTIYLVAVTKEMRAGVAHYVQTLHALDLGNGGERTGRPALIADTSVDNPAVLEALDYDNVVYHFYAGPSVAGTGAGGVDGQITFNALRQLQRPALALVNGTVYIAWASLDDIPPYHGWVLGYDASSLQLKAVLNTTPNGYAGGIWQSGGALAADAQGNLYVETGNGLFDGQLDDAGNVDPSTLDANGFPINADYGDSALKLTVDSTTPDSPGPNGWGLHVADYFTPYNQAFLDAQDLDFGSSGVTILPDAVGSADHPHLLIGAGKQHIIYLLDRDNLGKFHSQDDEATAVVQEVSENITSVFSTLSYFNGSVYYAGLSNTIYKFTIRDGTMTLDRSGDARFGYPGATLSISANGTGSGVVWAVNQGRSGAGMSGREGQLQAFRPDDLTQLFSDDAGPISAFNVPTVADGQVYVGTDESLVIYGPLTVPPPPAPRPAPAPAGQPGGHAIGEAVANSGPSLLGTDGLAGRLGPALVAGLSGGPRDEALTRLAAGANAGPPAETVQAPTSIAVVDRPAAASTVALRAPGPAEDEAIWAEALVRPYLLLWRGGEVM